MTQFTRGSFPGQKAIQQSFESQVQFLGQQGEKNATVLHGVIEAASTDSGNSPSTTLRAGLVLGRVTSTGKLRPYASAATDGSQHPVAILLDTIDMLDGSGSVEDKLSARIVTGGNVVKSSVIGLTPQAEQQLIAQGIRFDQVPMPMASAILSHRGSVYAAADVTLTSSDSGQLIVASKAGAFEATLPAIEEGLEFLFVQTLDQDMAISSNEGDNVLALNNAAADGVIFSTASQKIGAACVVKAIRTAANTLKWICLNVGPAPMTVVSA
ncbi:hypothetical protein GC197_14630 [bacterium]|nr:hypothetical protein [bacterium]